MMLNHIPAICLDEEAKSGYLKVIFAVNKASHDDGEEAICRTSRD
jgi:hypothetical protein